MKEGVADYQGLIYLGLIDVNINLFLFDIKFIILFFAIYFFHYVLY
jgi:hypothetical protein